MATNLIKKIFCFRAFCETAQICCARSEAQLCYARAEAQGAMSGEEVSHSWKFVKFVA